MNKMWTLILLVILLCISLSIPVYACVTTLPSKAKKQYDQNKMFYFIIDSVPEQTKIRAIEQYKECPPLRPERFRRRIKMLWGIDVNDYPEDAWIQFNNLPYYKISLKYQIIEMLPFGEHLEVTIASPQNSTFVLFRKYLLLNDMEAFEKLKNIVKDEDIDYRILEDIPFHIYASSIHISPCLIQYVDSYAGDTCNGATYPTQYNLDMKVFCSPLVVRRISDIKNNLLCLYINREVRKGRKIVRGENSFAYTENEIGLGKSMAIFKNGAYTYFHSQRDITTVSHPWQKNIYERNVASILNYMLQLQFDRSYVIKYMSGQIKYIEGVLCRQEQLEYQKQIRENIRSNNYYGYAVLREFCENPEREMPTLEKVGTSFDAVLAGHPKPLLLEPFADSYDIDTVLLDEAFIAYEMGYDDYYFIEIEKPVESPLAGTDGYAMILDRRETVYGYLKKEDVKQISEAEKATLKAAQERVLLQQPGRKVGFIDDPDGYVNLRKEMSVDAEIVSRIERTESFYYWEIPDKNWWFVQKRDGIKGFVHKSRIREKTSGESWIIDEKNEQPLGRSRVLL